MSIWTQNLYGEITQKISRLGNLRKCHFIPTKVRSGLYRAWPNSRLDRLSPYEAVRDLRMARYYPVLSSMLKLTHTLDSFITIQMLTGRPNGIFSDIAIDSISVSQCQCNSGSWITHKNLLLNLLAKLFKVSFFFAAFINWVRGLIELFKMPLAVLDG